MDADGFDFLARSLSQTRSRRALGAALGGLLALSAMSTDGKKKKKKKKRPLGLSPSPVCSPSCANRRCGDNGCGGSCGTCRSDQTCTGGACVAITPGQLTDTDATFVRCTATAARPYDLYVIDHPGGAFVASMRGAETGGGTLADPFLFLYDETFDPSQPGGACTGRIDENNTASGCTTEAFLSISDLAAGRYYLLASLSGPNLANRGTYTLAFQPHTCA